MIRLFVPERQGTYFLIPRRVAACMITPFSVRVAVVRSARSQRFIEHLIEQPIDQDPAMPRADRVSAAVQQAFLRVPAAAQLTIVIPSTQVIFKMITVPLMGMEKIKLIVPFEVEASLPFPWADAVIDCLITREDRVEKKAHVLVVATTKGVIEEQKAYFSALGRPPEVITTSALAVCGLSQDLPQFFGREHYVLTVCVDQQETIIVASHQGSIIALRSLSQGLGDIFAEEGVKKTVLDELARTIAMTGASFFESVKQRDLPKLVLCGMGSEHKELCEAISHEWNVACELVGIVKILHTGTITSQASLTNAFLVPIAAALPHELTDDINLDRDVADKVVHRRIIQQFVTAGLLVILLFTALFLVRGFMLRRMRTHYSQSTHEAIALLEKNIDGFKARKGATLDSVNKDAQIKVDAERNMWFSVASPNRFAALRVLLELSKKIKRDDIDLQLRRLDFEFVPREDRNKLVLDGKVKDIEALKRFEAGLKSSSMFVLLDTLQTPEFVAHIKLNITPEE